MKKTVLITGTAQGIGQATAKLFQQNRWLVIGIDKTANKKNCDIFLKVDLTDTSAPDEINTFLEANAIRHLNALVNNAAIQVVKAFGDINRSEWQKTFSVNVETPFFLIQRLLPRLKKARGSIVNVASIHAALTKQHFSLYAASKGALVTLTQALAVELAPEIRVNAVLPAATDTPMLRSGFINNNKACKMLAAYHPLKRIAIPGEIAQAIYFLADVQSSFITGASLPVHGGIGALLHDPSQD